MAKSLFEPKKIVRYANNQELIEGGLAGQSAPPRQVSATRSVPKVDSIPADASNVGSSNTPVDFGGSTGDNNPPPPPPPAGESRAFSFDGATELTGSLGNTFGSQILLHNFYIQGTFTPGWGETDTGRYTLMSLATPGSNEDRYDVSFVRSSIGSGYRDFLEVRKTSGSAWRYGRMRISQAGKFYSGSMENVYIEAHLATNGVNKLKVNGTPAPHVYNSNQFNQSALDYSKTFASSSLALSIGGLNSGSDHYYTGSISNLAVYYQKNSLTSRSTMASPITDRFTRLYYKFEESVSSSNGSTFFYNGIDLDVVGTETYVTSSI